MQESNSFAPRFAEETDFHVVSGDQLLQFFADTNSEVAGFLDICQEAGWEPVPLMATTAISGGPLSGLCFESLSSQLLRAIASEPIDGLLLALHGAMSSEQFPSGDAEFANRVRALLGPNFPFTVSHDFHANVHSSLLHAVDGISGYRTYPHVDMRETGRRAAKILRSVLSGKRAVHWYLPLPMLLSPESSSTFREPLRPVIDRLSRDFSESDGVHASLFCVQPWLDFKPVNGSVVITDFTRNPQTAAKVRDVGRQTWSIRDDFELEWTSPESLVERVTGSRSRPVLISEAYDSPTSGSAGDNPGLISLFLPCSTNLKGCFYLVDPQFVSLAQSAGEGATVEGELGCRIDRRFTKPLPIRARVERLSDGEFTAKGPAFTGRRYFMGPCAILSINKLRILVASKPVMMIDPELYRSQGIEPVEQDVIGIKSALLFRAAYESISSHVLYLDVPGPSLGRLNKVEFRHINRPIYPLDDFSWEPGDVRAIERQ
jgi:microcystin degradation protein MlrC